MDLVEAMLCGHLEQRQHEQVGTVLHGELEQYGHLLVAAGI